MTFSKSRPSEDLSQSAPFYKAPREGCRGNTKGVRSSEWKDGKGLFGDLHLALLGAYEVDHFTIEVRVNLHAQFRDVEEGDILLHVSVTERVRLRGRKVNLLSSRSIGHDERLYSRVVAAKSSTA